jgi:hypothetical protein
MNGEDLKFLADRADTVRGRPDQRLAEVHARIRSARRKRAAGAVAGASAAVLALVIGIAVLTGTTGTNKDNGPIPPANSPTKTDAPAAASTRRIVYGEGWPILTIHVGDRTVDISDLLPSGPNTPVYLNTTDDGVVVTVDDDESRIWFTDGTDVVPIGKVGVYTHIGSSHVVTGSSSSLAAWPDWSGGSTQLVVYDTSERVEVTRIDCPNCGSPEVVGSHVYWAKNEAVSPEPTTMFDAASGETSRVPATAYAEDLAGHPRGLVVGDSTGTGTASSGYGQVFRSDGRLLVPVLDVGPSSPGVTEWGPTTALDTGSGKALDLRMTAAYPSGQLFIVFDRLDDDRLALVADSNPGDEGWQIVVCRISTDQCRLAVPPTHDRRWAANLDFP